RENVIAALEQASGQKHYPPVVRWDLVSRRRITVVPVDHWLLLEDTTAFRAVLTPKDGTAPQHVNSTRAGGRHLAYFIPGQTPGDAELSLERYAPDLRSVQAVVRFVALPETLSPSPWARPLDPTEPRSNPPSVLLTNRRGGMARLLMDLGRI